MLSQANEPYKCYNRDFVPSKWSKPNLYVPVKTVARKTLLIADQAEQEKGGAISRCTFTHSNLNQADHRKLFSLRLIPAEAS